MKCPQCTDTTLVMSDRLGIEIDYCPSCRGVWLDRGELDRLIERSGGSRPVPSADAPQRTRRPDFVGSDYADYHGGRTGGPDAAGRRRKSWLSDLLD